jgi:hypothetical protein
VTKYRTNTHDAPQPFKAKPAVKPGTVDENHIPIFDHHGHLRGHVGHKATAATVARFGALGATLQQKDGRLAWVGQNPNRVRAAALDHAASVRAARGSVSSRGRK